MRDDAKKLNDLVGMSDEAEELAAAWEMREKELAAVVEKQDDAKNLLMAANTEKLKAVTTKRIIDGEWPVLGHKRTKEDARYITMTMWRRLFLQYEWSNTHVIGRASPQASQCDVAA